MDEKKLASECLAIQDACNPVAIAGAMHAALRELCREYDTPSLLKHPVYLGYLSKLKSLAEADVDGSFPELNDMAGGRVLRTERLTFTCSTAREQFERARKLAEAAGGEHQRTFQRCVDHLLRLKAEVARDTDVVSRPELEPGFFGWYGCGMAGGMVRHGQEWNLHS